MGLKEWFAGKVAGPQSYGDVLGRHVREGGAALANMVFISHGTSPDAGTAIVFDTAADMKAAGFEPCFEETIEIVLASLTVEEQRVFKSLQTAMISFAFIVHSNAALQYMRRDNTSKFRNGLGPSLLHSMADCGLVSDVDAAKVAVLSYVETVDSTSAPVVLNIERPAAGDLLERLIERAVRLSQAQFRYGFTRTGLTGFDIVAIPLVQETLKSILGATQQHNW